MNWIEIVGNLLLGVYITALCYITIFCLIQLNLLYKYSVGGTSISNSEAFPITKSTSYPFITIQLPIYNEKYVVGRLIDNIVLMDYPKDRFEIHILDDSTDETLLITIERVKKYQQFGYNIECITRKDRHGFKAGALSAAMNRAKGEFIAIFDADFLPNHDFLKQTMSAFQDAKVGVVQTRWDHINQKFSLLTELQAFQLNVHFTVEQTGRYHAGYLLQFNGTAGIWRKSCIAEAGGWEADTLTEDLDLSYRAQLKGWKIKYLEKVTSPSELPSEINGLKSQQYRWMKGGAETAKKLLPKVWASDIGISKKIHATAHLLSSSIFIFVFILGIFSVPLLFLLPPLGINSENFRLFFVSLFSIVFVYYVANVGVAWPRENKIKMIFKFLVLFPVFLALSMGLAFHNSLAVIQGFLGKKSAFVRTPKYGILKNRNVLEKAAYFSKKMDWISMGEGLLSIYFFTALYLGLKFEMSEFILLHLLLAIGYLILFTYAVQSKFSK